MGETRKKHHKNHNQPSRMMKTKRYKKDVDEILESLSPENVEKIKNRGPDPLLPGEGMHYCILCDRYFISAEALEIHKTEGKHKYQMKRVKVGSITPKEAELFARRGAPDNGRKIVRDESGDFVGYADARRQ